MSKLEKYSSYKDSGIEWVGEMPKHWELFKIKQLFFEKKKTYDISLNCGAISYGEVVKKDDNKVPEETKKNYQVVKKGDFLINPLNLNYDLVSLRIALSDLDVVVSSGYIVLNTYPNTGLNKTYFKWLLHRFDVAFMKTLGSGVRQTLNFSEIGKCSVVFPPIDEQIKISSFLNDKAEKIDDAISQKEKLIELLKEQKQTTINESVTKGLNQHVEFVDSGIEWIGKIPKHWGIEKGKRLFKQMKRAVREQDDIITCFRDGVVTLRSNRRTEGFTNALKEHGYQGIRKGDFVIHNMDAFAGAIGISDSDGKSTPVYSVCRPWDERLVLSEYYSKYLRNLALQDFILSLAKGIRERSTDFRFKDFGELVYPLPPKDEQLQIVEYIEEQTTKIDKAIELQQNYIAKLKEYKASLIDSVVTGKVRVA